MLRVVIIDDELSGRETLEILIQKHLPEVVLAGIADSATSGKELIEAENPDLVFLDIQMPGGSGFDLLNAMDDYDFDVIFVTAYNQHALKAFQFAALDYLLKPIKVKSLIQTVQRASEKKQQDSELKRLKHLVLQSNFQHQFSQENKIAFPTLEGFVFVPVGSIVRCKGSDSYSEVYFEDGKMLLVSRKLVKLEELLKEYRFFRVHKSHLINLNHLVKYSKGRGGEVEMTDGSFIEVSRRKKAEFLRIISG